MQAPVAAVLPVPVVSTVPLVGLAAFACVCEGVAGPLGSNGVREAKATKVGLFCLFQVLKLFYPTSPPPSASGKKRIAVEKKLREP